MDIRMPEMDGHGAISEIRSEKALAGVPVIALTASAMKEDIERIQQSGFDDYLIRPFDRRQLLATLARHLPHRRQGKGRLRQNGEAVKRQRPDYLEPWHCPEQVSRLLCNHLKTRWKETRRRQKIPDIQEFGLELENLGRAHDTPALVQYGADLRRHADNFQIDQIQTILGCYEKMLAMMK
jgi:two-component system sensor histidine kinase EvgS